MHSPISVIVGLGNPGKEYSDTRHNAGAMFVERLAENEQASFKPLPKFHALGGQFKLAHQTIRLLIPQTFMNLSGKAVASFLRFYRLESKSLLVVHDDLDLPLGTVRLKSGGGDGGHNGLRDLIAHLKSPDFVRLRIGIGHPGEKSAVTRHVLGKLSKKEAKILEESYQAVFEVLPTLLEGHLESAMNTLHTRVEQ